MSNIIKKERILVKNQVKETIPTQRNDRLCIELKIPKEKIDKEISIIKAGLIEETNNVKQVYEEKLSSLENEKTELDNVRNNFNEEMQKIRGTASEKAEKQGFEVGRTKGYNEGYANGHKKGQQEFELIKEEYIKHTKELFSKIQEVNEFKKQIFEKTEPYIISLIGEIVKKAVAEELVLRPETIVAIVRQALHKMNDAENIKIKVNPQHYNFLLDNKTVLQADLGMSASLEIVQSEAVQAGGCIIETAYGLVDSSVETKMIGIMEIINKVFDNKRSQVEPIKPTLSEPKEQAEAQVNEENDDLLFDENLLEDEELSLLDEEEDAENNLDEEENLEEDNEEAEDFENLDTDDLFKL